MQIKTKIALLDGELEPKGPITEKGRVGKGVILDVPQHVSKEKAQIWLDRGKAEKVKAGEEADAGQKTVVEKPKA